MSQKTFGLQRLRLLSTRPPGDHLALPTLAQIAILPSSSHLNSLCSQRPYVVFGKYSFFLPSASGTDQISFFFPFREQAGVPHIYDSTCHTPTHSCVSFPLYNGKAQRLNVLIGKRQRYRTRTPYVRQCILGNIVSQGIRSRFLIYFSMHFSSISLSGVPYTPYHL